MILSQNDGVGHLSRRMRVFGLHSLGSRSPNINSQQVVLLGYLACTVVRQYSISPPLNL
jgi:hypothetical protein